MVFIENLTVNNLRAILIHVKAYYATAFRYICHLFVGLGTVLFGF